MTRDNDRLLVFRGEKIGLGPLRSDLLETYQRWINDPRVTRTLGLPTWPQSTESEKEWLDDALTSMNTANFTVYELASMTPIGNTALASINWANRIANFGIMIGEPDAWNKGYGTETTRLVLQYAFDVLGLVNVMLEVDDHNPGAIRAYQRAGFKQIGVRRGARLIGRQRHDSILMDATPDDLEPSALHRLMQEGPTH